MSTQSDIESERLQLYDNLTKNPIPENIITYLHQTSVYNSRRSRTTTFDDLITLNLKELIPNIPMAEHAKLTNKEIEDWIIETKKYGEVVNTEFQIKCDEKMRIIIYSSMHKIRTEEFDVNKVKRLPDVLQLEVIKYLPTETKLTLLEERHPDIRLKMKKWKVSDLKTFYRIVVHDKYMKNIYDNYRRRCLTDIPFRLTVSNKDEYIREIFKVIDMYKNAVPRDLENYYRFKRRATQLFSSIVYVNGKILHPSPKKTKVK